MEFLRIIDAQTNEAGLQELITFDNLDQVNPSMFVIENLGDDILAGTLWGEFKVSLDKIKGGVRMALLDCPNALGWTITTGYPPDRKKVILHVTINRTRKAPEFVEEIEEFMDDWDEGIKNGLILP
jgi:hypothetical protein